MIDIHCHVLPGVDDGIKQVEDAVAFCRIARADGIRVLVATPHMKEGFHVNELAAIRVKVGELQARLESEEVDLRLEVGSEVYFCADLLQGIRERRLATLADGNRYLLLELPYDQHPVKVEETVFALKIGGITPIFAHPERVRYFQDDLDRLERVVRQGALSQLTATALTGGFGSKVEGLSLEMVRRGLVHFLASDAHDLKHRPPVLSAARERLASLAGEEVARAAVEGHPRAVLEGRPVEPAWLLERLDDSSRPSAFGRMLRRMRPGR